MVGEFFQTIHFEGTSDSRDHCVDIGNSTSKRRVPFFPSISFRFLCGNFICVVQMLAMWLQAKKEDECGKWWEICYNALGYVVIVLSIANIFEGIGNIRSHAAENWRWVYAAVLVVLALIAVALEIYRWIKSKNQQQMPFDDNEIYASQQL